ncbi:MAG: hypothetical protein IEMM0002_0444 [bacterium]|nr:MAG: hypothetical protein IEMM0002_0444 [bacterium]
MTNEKDQKPCRIAIIGMGNGGLSLAKMFRDDPYSEIVGVSNRRQNIPGIQWAKQTGIYNTMDYMSLLKHPDLDLVIDATGNPEVEKHLKTLGHTEFEIVKGTGARLLWRIVEAQKENEIEIEKSLDEQRRLYEIGIELAGAGTSEHALKIAVKASMDLLDMPDGSAALFDEEREEMNLAAVMGFDDNAAADKIWKLRPENLSRHILTNSGPTVIENFSKEHRFDMSALENLGYRSLIAVPLRVEDKIIGVIYLDGRRPRKFSDRELNHIGLLGTMTAFASEKLIMLKRAEEMALTDELTKIYNHRYFIRALKVELKRAQRYKEELGLCMIDVDDFKIYNDTHGHLRGNEILVQVADILSQSVRETDIVARYGGEEFSMIFPKTSKQNTALFIDRLRTVVEKYPFHGKETLPGNKLTVSIGVASYPDDVPDADDITKLIDLSDQALYKSKMDGKNRTTIYNIGSISKQPPTKFSG